MLPAETHVRAEMEELVEAGGFPTLGLYELLYMVDRPWNAWPSLHVSESLLLTLHIQRCLQARATRGRFTKACLAAIWTGWVLLSLSVLTTRQHFVWDLISGAGLGALLWVVYVRPRCRRWGLRVNSSGRD